MTDFEDPNEFENFDDADSEVVDSMLDLVNEFEPTDTVKDEH